MRRGVKSTHRYPATGASAPNDAFLAAKVVRSRYLCAPLRPAAMARTSATARISVLAAAALLVDLARTCGLLV